ncbi:MAG: formyltransferase family protein, partial [Candidatus Poseidonia sp.]|nr:formyltransferase family protein [Poseidonia sp.]
MTGTPVGGRVATAANPLRCAVLISGSGSGMEAMVKAQQQHDLFHTTSVVISNRSEAGGIQLAKKLGVKVELVLPPNDAENTRTSHEDLIMQIFQQYDIEFVVLS